MSISSYQPVLALNEVISTEGIFPSFGGGDFGVYIPMGSIRVLAWNSTDLFHASGALLSIDQYSSLFSLLGTVYGGDGQTTFEVPDLRGRVSIDQGQGPGLSQHDLGEWNGFSATDQLLASNLPAQFGGSATPMNDQEPLLTTNFYIRIAGAAPPTGSDAAPPPTFLGAITQFAGGFAPGGYAECNGQILTIAGNTALYSVLGTAYGGDGVTTFALPDLRGRTMVGADGTHALGQAFGSETLHITLANMPVNMGGQGVAIDNHLPSLAVTYLIADQGFFNGVDQSFLPDDEAEVGEVVAFAGNYAPAGYLVCDGRILNIADHATLFSAIGNKYGGDGTTTFALPNLMGRSIVGLGQGPGTPNFTLGQTAGTDTVTLTSADMPVLHINGTVAGEALYGGDANDTIAGLGGDDTLTGNLGNDSLDGGDGNDTASYKFALTGVTVSLAVVGAQVTGGGGTDTLTTIENLMGSNFKDKLVGDLHANVLSGLDGKDNLNGGAGDDTLSGDAGGDKLSGADGNDVLFGGDSDDNLDGGNGSDRLIGGGGADTMAGGSGHDVFVYLAVTESRGGSLDLITDLTYSDQIDLSAIDADSKAAGDQAFHIVSGALTGHRGELLVTYNSGTGQTSIQADVNGDGTADMTILVSGDHHDFTSFVL